MRNKSLGPVVLDLLGKALQEDEKEILCHPKVGGLILFSRNYEEPQQLQELVRCIREVREDLVLCVDHEGGRVQRFRQGFTELPPMQVLDAAYQQDPTSALHKAKELGWLMAAELLAYDVDLSFAPVLDVDDHASDIIGDRSFSVDPERVVSLAGAFIDGLHDAGMAATGKHFPGHGGVKADSHNELPVDYRELREIEARDLIPFASLHTKLDAVMSAHIAFPRIDEAMVSFSSVWLTQYLRDTLGFKGLVFSDDLSMEGAAGGGTYGDRAKQAIGAGCDVVLVCNNPDGAIDVLETLERDRFYDKPTTLGEFRSSFDLKPDQLKASARWQQAVAIVESFD